MGFLDNIFGGDKEADITSDELFDPYLGLTPEEIAAKQRQDAQLKTLGQATPAWDYTIGHDPAYITHSADRARALGVDYGNMQGSLAANSVNIGDQGGLALQGQGLAATQYGQDAALGIQGAAQGLRQAGAGAAAVAGDAGAGLMNTATGMRQAGMGAASIGGMYGDRLSGAGMDAANVGAAAGDRVANTALGMQAVGQQTGAMGAAMGAELGQAAAGMRSAGAGAAGAGLDAANRVGSAASNLGTAGQQSATLGVAQAAGVNSTARALSDSGAQLMGAGYQAANRGGPALAFGQQNNALGAAGANANALTGLEQTQGPSAAQAQLQAGTNASMAQSLALARSGRGYGGGAAALSGALQQNAATMQNATNSAAMLRAQEDAAWRQRQAQNLGAAAGIQQGLGTQFGQQQALGAQTQLASRAQNDAALQGLAGLGLNAQGQALQGQVNAGQLALTGQGQNLDALGQVMQGQATAGQLNLQGQGMNLNALNSAAQTQATGNQQALAAQGQYLDALGQSAGAQTNAGQLAMQGQNSYLAALGQGAQAAQQGQAQYLGALGQAAQTQATGGQMQIQGQGQFLDSMGQALQGQTAAGQLGLGAAATGANIYGSGVNTQLQGRQAGSQMAASGYQGQQQGAGIADALHIAQNASDQAKEDMFTQRYGISEGVGIARAQAENNLLGSMIGGGAAVLGGLAMASDARAKTNIQPASGDFPAPRNGEFYEVDLNPPGLRQRQGIEAGQAAYDAAQYAGDRYGLNYRKPVENADPRAPWASYDQNAANHERAQAEDDMKRRDALIQQGMQQAGSRFAAGMQGDAYGQYMNIARMGGFTGSDERAKGRVIPGAGETVQAAAATTPYSYEYNDPERFGSGRHYGVMAQDLEKTPAGRAVVKPAADGTKMVDTGKLTMQNTASIGELARDLDALKRTKDAERAGGYRPRQLNARDEQTMRDLEELERQKSTELYRYGGY